MKRAPSSKSALPWLKDWSASSQNFSSPDMWKVAKHIAKDSALTECLWKLEHRLALINGPEHAQQAVIDMVDACVILSHNVVKRHKQSANAISDPPPTRTERSRELDALLNELVSVQKKLRQADADVGNATSVSYLAARHEAGNPQGFSKHRMALRLDHTNVDVGLTITHLLAALHDDLKELNVRFKRSIAKKRQPGGQNKLANEVVDAVWHVVSTTIGRDIKRKPVLLIVELCRTVFEAHDCGSGPNESTIRSRLQPR